MEITVERGRYPGLFGGMGFHNSEACLYTLMEKEHFNQVICKVYRELSPGFMRTFAGYDDWTKEAMDDFAEYYYRMQKWTDTPMYLVTQKGKMHFSEEEMDVYCDNVAKNLEYLKKEKGVNHIRYYCFSNELTQVRFGWLMNDLPLFKKYHEKLYRAFQNRGIDVGLLATDDTSYERWNSVDWAIKNMSRVTEDYCLHIYDREHSLWDLDFYDFFYDKCSEYVGKAIRDDGKRLILGEFNVDSRPGLEYLNGVIADQCGHIESKDNAYSALMLTELVFAAINAGVFALAYWTFSDYPDPYSCAYGESGYAKKWGRVEKFASATMDVKYNKNGLLRWEDDGDYSARDFYWCIGYVCKLFKRNSKVLTVTIPDRELRACAVMNRDSSVTLGVVNRKRESASVSLRQCGIFKKAVRVYEYDSNSVPRNKFSDLQDYSALIDPDEAYELAPDSVTFFTTDYAERDYELPAAGVTYKNGVLGWSEVGDPNHCYYRVFRGEDRAFEPTPENQIASTVATELPVERGGYFKVLSVDRSGNCFAKRRV